MYYGSGAADRHVLADAASSERTLLHMQPPSEEYMSYQKPTLSVDAYLGYLKNNPAKFHPDPI